MLFLVSVPEEQNNEVRKFNASRLYNMVEHSGCLYVTKSSLRDITAAP